MRAALRERGDCILVYALALGVWGTIMWIIIDKL